MKTSKELKENKRYEYNECRICGRKLTTPNSRLLGIGPECLDKYKNSGKHHSLFTFPPK